MFIYDSVSVSISIIIIFMNTFDAYARHTRPADIRFINVGFKYFVWLYFSIEEFHMYHEQKKRNKKNYSTVHVSAFEKIRALINCTYCSRNDGSFSVTGLPSGTYLVEVANPAYLFEPQRVDITSTGKMRARKVNLLQPTKLQTVQYPMEFRVRGKTTYFQQREQWRITDFLFNPMVCAGKQSTTVV